VIAVLGVIGLLAVVVPAFVDLNSYKAEIAAQARQATGRDLAIDGDISLSLLPAPGLSVGGLRLANIPGAHNSDMVTVRSLDVRVALLPLLGGEVEVERITLIEPAFALERLSDGRTNWAFDRPSEKTGSSGTDDAGTDRADTGIRLSRVEIEGGRLAYRDAQSGTEEIIDRIDARFSADSLSGPYDLDGALGVRGMRLGVIAQVGRLDGGGQTPVQVTLNIGEAEATLRVAGTLSGASADATFAGTLQASGSRVDRLAAIGGVDGADLSRIPALARPFELRAKVAGGASGVDVNDIDLRVGDLTATGAVSARTGETARFDVALSMSRLDLDAWLPATQANAGADATPSSKTPAAAPRPGSTDPILVPGGLAGSVALNVDAISYRGGVMSQFEVGLDLANGELKLSRLGVLLPGNSAFSAGGTVKNMDGTSQFDGTVKLTSDNLRTVLGWLGTAPEGIAKDRLRNLALTATVRATPALLQVYGVDLRLDSSRMSGGFAYAFRERPAFSIDAQIDQLNLDAYLPPSAAPAAEAAPSRPAGEQPATGDPLVPQPVAAMLEAVDTNTKVAIGVLTYRGVSVRGALIDAGLLGGELTLRQLRADSLGGAKVAAQGRARGFSTTPSAEASLDLSASDISGLTRLAGIELPFPAARLGKVAVKGKLGGDPEKTTLDLTARTDVATASLVGSVELRTEKPKADMTLQVDAAAADRLIRVFDPEYAGKSAGAVALSASLTGDSDAYSVTGKGRIGDAQAEIAGRLSTNGSIAYNLAVSAAHPDAARFFESIGIDYRPAATNLGGLSLAADVAGGDQSVGITNLKGRFGPVAVDGRADVRLGGPRPSVTASLATSEILVDLFLPREEGRRSDGRSGSGTATTPRSAARWSDDPIDLSGLRTADLDLDLAAGGILYGTYTFAEPKVKIRVRDGRLDIDPLTGKLFEGTVTMRARAEDARIPSVSLALDVSGGNLQRALVESVGHDMVSGLADLTISVAASGRSQRELVSALGGKAAVVAKNGAIEGIDLRLLSERLKRLNEIGDYLGLLQSATNGGKTEFLSMTADVEIDRGIARTTRLEGDLDAARLTGTAVVDLPRWSIDLKSEARLTEHPEAPALGIDLSGSLDAPRRDVRTRAIEQYLAQRVGGSLARKYLPKEVQGLGSVLFGGAGAKSDAQAGTQAGGASGNTSAGQGAGTQQPQAPQQAPTPENLLRGLLKGLGK
jgi:uncharacterized protein involved in outer membrane biogenesis